MSRWLRVVVCLILVCCILVNASPIRVQASVLGTSVLVDGLYGIAAILIGLGIMPGGDQSVFDSLVNDISGQLSSLGYYANGFIEFIKIFNGTKVNYYASKNLIDVVRNFLFYTAVLIDPLYGMALDAAEVLAEARTYPYCYTCTNGGKFTIIWSTVPCAYFSAGYVSSAKPFSGDSVIKYHWTEGDSTITSFTSSPYYIDAGSFQTFTSGVSDKITTSSDLTLGYVASSSVGFSSGYAGWSESSVSSDADNGENQIYFPVGVGSTYEETKSQTQAEVQTGESTYVESESGVDSETGSSSTTSSISQSWLGSKLDSMVSSLSSWFNDFISSIKAIPGSLEDFFASVVSAIKAIPAAIAEALGLKAPSDVGHFTIDLTKYFPFCIPFDLYDFFQCLQAEPTAPVIEWLIPMPGSEGYELEIDLSAFDDVALLLRRLELLLFCVGLAFKTRDLIRG